MHKRYSFILILAGLACVAFSQTAGPVTPTMVHVDGGKFVLGDEIGDPVFYGSVNETPKGEVGLSSYYIGNTELTVGEFAAFVKDTGYVTTAEKSGSGYCYLDGKWKMVKGASWKDAHLPAGTGKSVAWPVSLFSKPASRPQAESEPVVLVSWYDAVAYCNWRSAKEGLTPAYTVDGSNVACNFDADGYRLPTEAEWEYAAKGGIQHLVLAAEEADKKYNLPPFPGSAGLEGVAEYSRLYTIRSEAAKIGWFVGNAYGAGTHQVGQKAPNQLGLYDMAGNVWEWCWDWFMKDAYQRYADAAQDGALDPNDPTQLRPSASDTDKQVQADKLKENPPQFRTSRGGAWMTNEWNLRTSARGEADPTLASNTRGFRIVRSDVAARKAAVAAAAAAEKAKEAAEQAAQNSIQLGTGDGGLLGDLF